MSKEEIRLDHVADIAKLSRDQFKRMLPDFVAWFGCAKRMQEAGVNAQAVGFIWVDDDSPGVIREINITLATKEQP